MEKIKEMLVAGKIEEALKSMQSTVSTVLLAKFNGAKKQYNLGLIDFSEWTRIQAQINFMILQVLEGEPIMMEEISKVNPISKPKRPDFSKLKIGDEVFVDGQPGFSMAQQYAEWCKVEKIETKFNPDTGEPTIRFFTHDQWFDQEGYPCTSPFAYYCSSIKKIKNDN